MIGFDEAACGMAAATETGVYESDLADELIAEQYAGEQQQGVKIALVDLKKATAGAEKCAETNHAEMANAIQVTTDGVLGHGWACAVCGEYLQAG